MAEVAGRPIIAAFLMLFSFKRLFLLSDKQRLPAILSDSRKYQNLVSTQLAEQVLAALYELVRGFQSADDQRRGDLLREVLADDPNHVYAGLLTVLMRLVFILYAEDRNLLSNGCDRAVPVPRIMRLFWAFSSSNPPESPSQEESSLASMPDTPESKSRSVGSLAGPRSIGLLPNSRSFLTVSAVA